MCGVPALPPSSLLPNPLIVSVSGCQSQLGSSHAWPIFPSARRSCLRIHVTCCYVLPFNREHWWSYCLLPLCSPFHPFISLKECLWRNCVVVITWDLRIRCQITLFGTQFSLHLTSLRQDESAQCAISMSSTVSYLHSQCFSIPRKFYNRWSIKSYKIFNHKPLFKFWNVLRV
jgi:hypothetical protein